MQATLTFYLPEDEAELRAAIDGPEHVCSIRDFQERLRNLVKYGHPFSSADDAISGLYTDYCEAMQAYL
jgi:hypothetical protein